MTSSSSSVPPLAIFMWVRRAAVGSWVASRPARSADSSALRDHSSSPTVTIRMPIAPPGTA